MKTRRRALLGLASGLAVGAVSLALVAPGAQAQGEDMDLDLLRALVPEGEPGEYDITEGSILFGELAETFGMSTEVSDFGDSSELKGLCGGFAFSYGEDGTRIDAAMDLGTDAPPIDLLDGGQAFTSSNPFKVDTRGVVVYYGFSPESGDGPENHRWTIKTGGISVDSGGDPNPNLKNRNAGLVDLANDLPVKFSAKVRVEGEMTSANQPPCIGKGHVEFIGNGLTDPVGLAALALLGGGLIGILFNARPARTWKG